jgi:Ca-activated chloride channel family protein
MNRLTISLSLATFGALLLGCSDASEAPAVRPSLAATPTGPAIVSSSAAVDPATPPAAVAEWVRSARTGSLLLRTQDGTRVSPSLDLATEIDLTVTGTIARAVVRQKFHNPSENWVEGLYVFPLPDDAGVDHMEILTDGRVIEGQVQEKEEARKTYQAAKAEGKRAGLVEQQRPNVFTTRIANIRPGALVTVEVEYQQSVRLVDGTFSIRVPTVVAPRFLPGHSGLEAALPTIVHPFEITVDLAPGFDLETLESPYHPVVVSDDGRVYHVTLAEGPVRGDRDFVLEWTAAPGQGAQAVIFTETLGVDTYALMMVTPPFQADTEAMRIPRDVVYVVDTSGSMAGASIIQAQTALAFALQGLYPGDRFNIIHFDDVAEALFEETRASHPSNIEEALDYVAGLEASGGTEFAKAIEMALAAEEGGRRSLRQVVFLTDGSVGNEAQLLEKIKDDLGESRIFAIGIGGAPNTYFMRKLAQHGRGSFTHIGSPDEVEEKMTALFDKLESAVLADVEIALPDGNEAEMYPYDIPDLYVGEPVVAALKLTAPLVGATVTGWTGDSPWQVDLEEANFEERPGIHTLWARQAIEERMDDRLGTRDAKLLASLRAEVIEIALDHHLVSAYTSLVAVDVTPERYTDEALVPHRLGARKPAGWQADSEFGFAQGATPAGLRIAIGLLFVGTAWVWRWLAS